MPVDYYPQKSEAQLIEMLESLQKGQTSGRLTEVAAAGVRTVRAIGGKDAPIETQILRVLYSLFLRNPGTRNSGGWENPYGQRIRRTRARYTFS